MYALKTHKKKPVMDEGGSPFVVPTWKVQELVAMDTREGLMEIEWPRTGPVILNLAGNAANMHQAFQNCCDTRKH
jgi:hypothetical protein